MKKDKEWIKKYIKRMFGISEINILVKECSYSMTYWPEKNAIIIDKKVLDDEKDKDAMLRVGLWHEVGHIKTFKWNNMNKIDNEVKATEWSLNEMLKRRYFGLYNKYLKILKDGLGYLKNKAYIKVIKKILKKYAPVA